MPSIYIYIFNVNQYIKLFNVYNKKEINKYFIDNEKDNILTLAFIFDRNFHLYIYFFQMQYIYIYILEIK